jgi:hypothetical protein
VLKPAQRAETLFDLLRLGFIVLYRQRDRKGNELDDVRTLIAPPVED